MGTVNTALSVMAYDYPPEKISVYVSDDGGSQVTLFAFMEAAKFGRHWLPFCRENNVVERCPEAYFNGGFYATSRSLEADKMKTMYESMKVRVENALERGKVEERHIDDEGMLEAFAKWTNNFTRQVHPTVIQVLLSTTKDKDVTGKLMPNLIYVSREKSKVHHHRFKAGALNALVRVSATMTNAPIVLTLDCDTYSNDPQIIKRALCYFLDPEIRPTLAYLQFPQIFRGLNKGDIYFSEHKRLFQINPLGMDGLYGPNYVGTGCFFQRRAFFGSPSSLIQPEVPELSPNHVVNKPIRSQEILELAHSVAACNYENKEEWGEKISDPRFLLYIFLFIGANGKDLIDFLLEKGTFERWWNAQRMLMICGLSSFLFGCIDYALGSLGITIRGFDVTSKLQDNELSKRYDQGTFEFGVASPMFVPMTMAAIINLISFVMGVLGVFRKGMENMEGLILQILLSGFVVINCWPLYQAMVFRSDKGRMPTKITLIAAFLASILIVGS
uniref:Cellulose synthase-like protein G3 n=1 Tax=Chenopodium quinoa TaxID=63459 RepID=A0A803L568_CHEQI